MVEKSTSLDQRYGRKPTKLSKKNLIVLSVAILIASLAVIAWFAVKMTKAPSVSDISGTLEANKSVTVNFTVNNPTQNNIRCGVRALNNHYAVVGYKAMDIDAQKEATASYSVNLLTDSPATSADVEKCWTMP
ncbi:MAG: DUF4307 domain-containing protein [Micrococcaceae bacterium]